MSHLSQRVSACVARAAANARCLFGKRRLRHSALGWPFAEQVASPELFVNARGTPFSRWGVAYVLRRHTETADRKCLTLRGKQVSPHVLRHTCAMIVLQATKDIRKVSLWLGHSDLTTTEVYVRADPS